MMNSGDGTQTSPKCASVSSFGESLRQCKRVGGGIFNVSSGKESILYFGEPDDNNCCVPENYFLTI